MNVRQKGIAAMLAALTLAACSDAPSTAPPQVLAPSFDISTAAACGTTTTVNLERTTGAVVGTVQAWNDATDLHVAFTGTQVTWHESFVNVSLTAGAIPLLPNGTPKLGAFAYRKSHNPRVGTYEYVIPLSSVGGTTGTDLVIAAIAILAGGPPAAVSYGDGTKINPPAAHEYFVHTVQRCGSPPPPPPGKDIVVFNDINVFDAGATTNANNVQMVKNLANYTTSGPRNAATQVAWDRGRNARCGTTGNNECNDTNMGNTRSAITSQGLTMVDIFSSSGTLDDIIATQGANWKSIWLWTPLQAFTVEEVNALKQFANEGGRVVFIGEFLGYYPQSGIDLENQFLLDMGAVMTNTGGAVNCGYNTLPATSLRPHQITTGVSTLTIACSSVLIPGPNDFPLYYDLANTNVLSAVATIDVNPISTSRSRYSNFVSMLQPTAGLVNSSSTGR
ncbi:MAG: ABC transporter [Cytophagaceae bacterium]|nr:ABC transporter [Gemmatimonadaceae bacterium]